MADDGDEAEVLRANERFYAAFTERDFAAMSRAWAERARVTCIHPHWNVLEGRDAVLRSWAGIMNNPAQPRVVAGGAEVTVAGDLAVVVCREFVAGVGLLATNVFMREDGDWRLLHHHSSPVAAEAS
ncbi:MAG: nuclear transport factor 2 family protein [Dehalococcoidia bacterium]|nr:nuclear transport factor 2 family protein [Dehalococcoidia bacterium]